MRQPDYPSAEAERWIAVDTYFAGLLAPEDEVLRQTLIANAEAGLPAHDVSALQGQMLALLVQITGARRVLEIGTLGGYSTIHIARALRLNGIVTTIEADQHHAAIARSNIDRAGMSEMVELLVGKALDILPTLAGPFDLVFIDADKPNNPDYVRRALDLARPGTVIVGDNVVRGGAVLDRNSTDPNVQGVRSFLEIIAAEPRLAATAVQTVGEKGWDGFVLARVGD
jgi:predicted O-methyltransferase YrrM